jgi:hypothetical protein
MKVNALNTLVVREKYYPAAGGGEKAGYRLFERGDL